MEKSLTARQMSVSRELKRNGLTARDVRECFSELDGFGELFTLRSLDSLLWSLNVAAAASAVNESKLTAQVENFLKVFEPNSLRNNSVYLETSVPAPTVSKLTQIKQESVELFTYPVVDANNLASPIKSNEVRLDVQANSVSQYLNRTLAEQLNA